MYRSTYSDNAAWTRCIERVKAGIWESLRNYNGMDLLSNDHFRLTVLEEKEEFDGATTRDIRQHFAAWTSHPVRSEQGSPSEIKRRRAAAGYHRKPPYHLDAVRYRYCVQTNEAAVQSILSPEGEKAGGDALGELYLPGLAAGRPV